MRGMWKRAGVCTVTAAGLWAVPVEVVGQMAGSGDRAAAAAIAGLWGGTLEVHGQRSSFGLRFTPAEGDSVDVALSMPAIGVFDAPAGRGVIDANGVRLGGWSARFDPDGGTIEGMVPSAILPGHEVPFTLRRREVLDDAGFERLAAEPMEPAWTRAIGAPVWAGLVAVEGGVLVGADDGTVRRIDRSGETVWTQQLSGAVRATPTIGEERLFVPADDGTVTALSLGSGEVLWSTRIDDPAERIPPGDPESRYDHYGSSLRVVGGVGYLGVFGGGVVALGLDVGEVLWRAEESSSVLGTPATDGSLLYYGTFGGDVVAVDLETGREVWRVATGGAVVGAPAISDGIVVVGNRSYDVIGVRAEDGVALWHHYYWWSWVESSPVVSDGTVFVGSSDAQRLNALDLRTGALQWSDWVEGSAWSAPALSDGEIVAGTVGVAGYMTDHRARLFRVDLRTGSPIGRLDLARPEGATLWGFAAAPAVGSDFVFAATIGGRVMAFPR
jgi:outer membrane protein assembly factor BamB